MKKLWLSIAMCLVSPFVLAAPTGEDAKAMVEHQSQIILAKLATDAEQYRQNPDAFATLVNHEVLPYLDVELMSRIVLGRHWQQATPAQREAFVRAFTDLLVRVYSRSWTNYTGASVAVLGMPSVDEYQRSNIRTQVVDNRGKKVNITFSAHYDNGQWKIYDVNFEGVSILTSYRNSFDTEIANIGLDALINKIGQMKGQAQ